MHQRTARQSPTMRHFSTLAGSFQKLPSRKSYTVQFTNLLQTDNVIYRYWTKFIACGALVFVIGLGAILFQPAHWIITQTPNSPIHIANFIMLVCLALLQIFLIIGTLSATRSTLKARDPIPVRPPSKLRVAFVTTRAPGEPIEMVRTTLEAAKRIRYKRGEVDVWLLDETYDLELLAICIKLKVRYFSRKGVEEWNTPKPSLILIKRILLIFMRLFGINKHNLQPSNSKPNPFFAAKTKHGNFNSWQAHLETQGIIYDILAGVDTDQVPEPNYLERLLGYFRDPDVAYIVGPQVYGNYSAGISGLVTRFAESQASFFQSTIQRAGNATSSAMFVGTNYAIRMKVLKQIGGFQPCITEDMATGLAIHTKRNPLTGKRWKSVYTPDVLAVGSGPDLWGPYFTQQWRWAAGTFDTWRRVVWRIFFRLSPGAFIHYFLMLTFYPITALTWLLGIISSLTYLATGATAILAPWSQFVSLYLMTVIMQLSLYFWNRRNNVSPHEPEGSYGINGMLASTLTAPIYLSALIGIALGKKASFVVTVKGDDAAIDRLKTFRTHLKWGVILLAGLVYGILHNHSHPAMLVWVGVQLVVCLAPVVLGMYLSTRANIRKYIMLRPLTQTRQVNE